MDMTPADGKPGSSGEISDQLEGWLEGDGDHTVAGLLELFEEKAFALLFIVLLGVSALPLPTGGATHVFDIIAMLAAGQLVAGRGEIWMPKRWRALELAGSKQRRFFRGLLRFLRFLERFSRPRLQVLFDRRASNVVFGLTVITFTLAAFLAPPFSGLDTLPALGVVLLSVAVLREDFVVVVVALAVGVAGIGLEIALGRAALSLF